MVQIVILSVVISKIRLFPMGSDIRVQSISSELGLPVQVIGGLVTSQLVTQGVLTSFLNAPVTVTALATFSKDVTLSGTNRLYASNGHVLTLGDELNNGSIITLGPPGDPRLSIIADGVVLTNIAGTELLRIDQNGALSGGDSTWDTANFTTINASTAILSSVSAQTLDSTTLSATTLTAHAIAADSLTTPLITASTIDSNSLTVTTLVAPTLTSDLLTSTQGTFTNLESTNSFTAALATLTNVTIGNATVTTKLTTVVSECISLNVIGTTQLASTSVSTLNVSNLIIPVTAQATIAGTLTVSGSTAFTNLTDVTLTNDVISASLIVQGGCGISKSLLVKATVTAANVIAATATLTTLQASTIGCTGSITATSGTLGALVLTNTSTSLVTQGTVVVGTSLMTNESLSVGTSLTVGQNLILPTGIISIGTTTLSSVNDVHYFNTPAATWRFVAPATVLPTLDIFAKGSLYTALDYESFQMATGSTTFRLATRAAGLGILRSIALQAGSNTDQILLQTNGKVRLGTNTDAYGAVVIPTGGLTVSRSLLVGETFQLSGITLVPPSNTAYTLLLPNSLPSDDHYSLVSDKNGQLSWSPLSEGNANFISVRVQKNTTQAALDITTSASEVQLFSSLANGTETTLAFNSTMTIAPQKVVIAGSLDIAHTLSLYEPTMAWRITVAAPATLQASYNLILPDSLPAMATPSLPYALVSDGTGTLSWGLSGPSPDSTLTVSKLVLSSTDSDTLVCHGQANVNALLVGNKVKLNVPSGADTYTLTLPSNLNGALYSNGLGYLVADTNGKMDLVADPPSTQKSTQLPLDGTAHAVSGLVASTPFDFNVFATVGGSASVYKLRGYPTPDGTLFTLFVTHFGDDLALSWTILGTGQFYVSGSSNMPVYLTWQSNSNGYRVPSVGYSTMYSGVPSSTPKSIPGLVVDTLALHLHLNIYVALNNGQSQNALCTLQAVYDTSAQAWQVGSSFFGTYVAIAFTIDAHGQIYYTCTLDASAINFVFYPPKPTYQTNANFDRVQVNSEIDFLTQGTIILQQPTATRAPCLIGTNNSGFYSSLDTTQQYTWQIQDGITRATSQIASLTAQGQFTVSGTVVQGSDRRIKTGIMPISGSDALSRLKRLQGCSYRKRGVAEIGLIAQEVEKVIPEIVFQDPDGLYGVAYSNLVAILVEALKEISEEVAQLKKVIKRQH